MKLSGTTLFQKKKKKHPVLYITALILAVLYLFPLYVLFNMSLRSIDDLSSKLIMPQVINLGNYIAVLRDSSVWNGFKNSLILMAITVVVEITVSALGAYGIARSNTRLTEFIRQSSMAVMMIPAVALLVGTYSLMTRLGLVNSLTGLAFLLAAGGIPGCMFMYTNFVTAIPVALDEAAMIDGQIRQTSVGFDENSLLCLSTHEIFGDDTLILESVATYQFAPNFVRKGANAKEETQYWMRAAMMGGVSPSTHFIGGVQEDKRALQNGAEMFAWHKRNEEYLYHRRQIARIALVRSLKNTCYYGKDRCQVRTVQPMNGMVAALKRARLPFYPIDSRQMNDKLEKLKLIILPDIAVLSDDEIGAIEKHVKNGGSLVLTGATGMLDELGYPRKEFPTTRITTTFAWRSPGTRFSKALRIRTSSTCTGFSTR